MGCGASSEAPVSGAGAPVKGAFAPFSAESFATLTVKCNGKTFGQIIDQERTGPSAAICEGYGICAAKPFHLAIANQNEDLARYRTPANGARLALKEDNQLSLVFASLLPLNAPCALYTKPAAGISPIIIQGSCNLVDIFLSVDGNPQVDGHICCGDASIDRAAAIKNAIDKQVPGGMEEAAAAMLEKGPGTGKPWATLVNKDRNFESEHFVYLPLLAASGKSVDDMMIEECTTYAEGLMAKFASLLAAVGPGEHIFDLRIAPRCAITTGENVNINGQGQYHGGISIGPEQVLEKGDEGFTSFVKSQLESQLASGGIIAADEAGMRASFTLEIDESVCRGSSPERLAQPFASYFADDVAEHCQVVMTIAHTGPMGAAARDCLSKDPGKAVHVVLPDREDHPGNIGDFGADRDVKAGGRHFAAWAFFLNPDTPEDDDAQGCMVKCWISKYTKKDFKPVPSPVWITENMGMFPPVKFKISNRNIRAAIERDRNDPNGWVSDEA